ncbi:MAG: response regulator [Butyrivibrio sp.]|nr:response regulator [Butyrivibrio sp.]
MHLAICDDNIADRKQTERLLGRQSDRIFKETGDRIYIDSYGNVEAFMQKPHMYNALFVDVTQSDISGVEVVKMLLADGVVAPIIMCSEKNDYRTLLADAGVTADNIRFLDKPIKVAELTSLIDMVQSLKGHEEPTLELRGKKETIYAKGDDIVCAFKPRSASALSVYLQDGRTIEILQDAYNFYDQCAIFPQICPVSDNAVINIHHISNLSFGKVTLDNDVTLHIAFSYRNSIKQACQLDS